MTDPAQKLTPADPRDLADALAFALRFEGGKRARNADEVMAEIVARRLVEHLERAGFVVMKRPPIGGASSLARGFDSGYLRGIARNRWLHREKDERGMRATAHAATPPAPRRGGALTIASRRSDGF
jgi:hypothetical protein